MESRQAQAITSVSTTLEHHPGAGESGGPRRCSWGIIDMWLGSQPRHVHYPAQSAESARITATGSIHSRPRHAVTPEGEPVHACMKAIFVQVFATSDSMKVSNRIMHAKLLIIDV